VYPVLYPRVSSDYGVRYHPIKKINKHHHGVDLAAPSQAPILSVASGKVVFSGSFNGYGKFITIQHPNGYTTHYGHCDKLQVEIGQYVSAGEVIGLVGSTGLSTGPHLHFEIRKNGKALDPENYLPELRGNPEG
jgi:murein DD-endopeptidase MepM/ murein hydrolase activator NlpD